MNYYICLSIAFLPIFCFGIENIQRPNHSDIIVTISQQELEENTVEFERKLKQGARDGIFYIEIPTACKNLIPHAHIFGDNFYKNEELKNKKFPGFNGYQDRKHAQLESFYAEYGLWKEVFPEEIIQLATYMNVLATKLLKKILDVTVPHLQLAIDTEEVCNNKELYQCMFNHYRPEKDSVGLTPHKDFGFITLLNINSPGLIAQLNGIWGTVLPKENHFIVNLGRALESLINDSNKVTAVLHAVEQIKDQEGRTSFGLSANNSFESASLYSKQKMN